MTSKSLSRGKETRKKNISRYPNPVRSNREIFGWLLSIASTFRAPDPAIRVDIVFDTRGGGEAKRLIFENAERVIASLLQLSNISVILMSLW